MEVLQSVHELIPEELSGRYARSGFVYQDHISASFCLGMLMNTDIAEVWLESHDDITLIRGNGNTEFVELIQVKATDNTSRWSVASICSREGDRVGTSIIEKSLNGAKFKEPVRYRIVSLYDVNDDLKVLKLPIGGIERNGLANQEEEMIQSIVGKLNECKAPNGNDLSDWVKSCYWDKRPDSIKGLRASNLIQLEGVLTLHGYQLYGDQRDELYQKLLALCQDAATAPINGDHSLYKLRRDDITAWLKDAVGNLKKPQGGTARLKSKLIAGNVNADYIDSAIDLKRQYSDARRSSDFMEPSEFQQMEAMINGEMYRLKIALDSGRIDESGFHDLCISIVDGILDDALKNKNIPRALAYGYLYDLTNRCLHRYKRPQA